MHTRTPTKHNKSSHPLQNTIRTLATLVSLSSGLIGCQIQTIDNKNGSNSTSIPSEFTLSSPLDSIDTNPGDKRCADTQNRCTLRAAIMEANALEGAQTINIPAGTYTLTIAGAGEEASKTGDLDLSGELRLLGTNAASTIINGNGLDRVFDSPRTFAATASIINIKNVTIQGGTATSDGGGMLTSFTNLTLENVTFASNTSTGDGGGLLTEFGNTKITNVRFENNTATGSGGGFASETTGTTIQNSSFIGNTAQANTFREGGGGLYAYSQVEVRNSLFSGNKAATGSGGGILGRAITIIGSHLTENTALCGGGFGTTSDLVNDQSITSSSLVRNTATNGAGVCINGGSLTMLNTTISGNTASEAGGGFFITSSPVVYIKATMTHMTLAGNTAIKSGGSDVFVDSSGGEVNIRSSILASTGAKACNSIDSFGKITSTGYNVIADASCKFSSSGDIENSNAQLAVLSAVSNQVIQVRIPAVLSPAINRVPVSFCSGADARGITRLQGLTCDAGAVDRTDTDP